MSATAVSPNNPNSKNSNSNSSNNNNSNNNWRQVQWIQERRGRQIAQRLFRTFVVFEDLDISREVLSFLSESLIDNLQEKEWLNFIFTTIELYLSRPVIIRDTLPENLFS